MEKKVFLQIFLHILIFQIYFQFIFLHYYLYTSISNKCRSAHGRINRSTFDCSWTLKMSFSGTSTTTKNGFWLVTLLFILFYVIYTCFYIYKLLFYFMILLFDE